jgi:hypothetical protein
VVVVGCGDDEPEDLQRAEKRKLTREVVIF